MLGLQRSSCFHCNGGLGTQLALPIMFVIVMAMRVLAMMAVTVAERAIVPTAIVTTTTVARAMAATTMVASTESMLSLKKPVRTMGSNSSGCA